MLATPIDVRDFVDTTFQYMLNVIPRSLKFDESIETDFFFIDKKGDIQQK